MRAKQGAIPFAYALVGWGLCGATMALGMTVTSLDNALLIHAAAAPIIFGALAWDYMQRFALTTPLQTAGLFVGVVIVLDVVVVGLLIQHSLAMFGSLLGTWIPFALIGLSTFTAARLAAGHPSTGREASSGR